MTLNWTPMMIGPFTVRELEAGELWSQAPGDATAETIVEETAWEGAAAAPGTGRAKLEGWLALGAWILGIYDGDRLIGLFDAGRLTTWAEATGEEAPDGAGDRFSDLGPAHSEPICVTIWTAIRPSERKRVPGPIWKALAAAFHRRLWDLGVRRLVTTHVRTLAEGRAHAERAEQYGWRTVIRRGHADLKVKRLERPT